MKLINAARLVVACMVAMLIALPCSACWGDESLMVRAESLALLPKSKPMLYVQVLNTTDEPVTATVSVKVPESWRLIERSQEVELAGGEQKRLGFSVADGDEDKANAYAIEITARSGEHKIVRRQTVSVTSAPYFKPTIDGDPSDWKDAIPVSFTQGNKKTTVATYWNRRQFSMLVSVEEADHVRRGHVSHGHARCFDAVQVVLAPRGTTTSRSADQEADRFEYLVFADAAGDGHCCQLARPGWELAEVGRSRPLEPLMYDRAQVAVNRLGTVTHYEFSLPLSELRDRIKPGEGREFYLSLLVHDPGGTGVRDWGLAAGMWERQRNRLAWSGWEGAQWGDRPPMDCRAEWAMCSSKY